MVGFMKSALNLFGIGANKEGGAQGINLEEFLTELPNKTGFSVAFKRVDSDTGNLCFEVVGDDAAEFLGKNTEMLDALSHLSMRILRKTEGASNTNTSEDGQEKFRVIFDSAGFRDQKIQELKSLAAAQRDKVISSGGKPAYISALSPAERKVIHTHLADLGDVVSESIGKGNFKRIRVRLVDGSPHKREMPASEGTGGEGRPPRSHNGGPRGNGRGNRSNARNGAKGGRGNRFGGGNNRGPKAPLGLDETALDSHFNSDEYHSSFDAGKDGDDIDDNIGNR